MAVWDWLIVGLYVACAVGIGVYFTKRAARSTEDFFVAGRTLPWFIAGTSIVATTFSADTPLVVAAIARQTGIFENWWWWSFAIGGIATVFFFAKLWRRTEAVTDIEFIAKRYEPSKVTSVLRVFRAVFDGVLVNCIIMASVTLAMAKILKIMLNLSDSPLFHVPIFGPVTPTVGLLLILGICVVIYTTLSGLYGVVYLDFVQFAMAMVGSIGLAVIVYVDASKGPGLMANLSSSPHFTESMIRFFPDISKFNLTTFAFFVYICIVWWQEAPGKGYFVQRILATRSEKDAVYAALWFNICHYVIRPWPWIIVGLLSIYYLPDLQDPEAAFPAMIDKFLPVGLKGIMVASLLAAFMSTLDTHLNWGTSYLLNDIYKPFINKNKDQAHYIKVARICMLALTLVALVVTTRLTTILDAYKYLFVLYAGIGTVMIARWYWWRVNAYSEISAIFATFIIANVLEKVLPNTDTADLYSVRVVITTVSVTIIWLIVMFLTSRKEPEPQVIEFYKKMKISGPGWEKLVKLTSIQPKIGEFKTNFTAWLSCTILLFALLLGVGKLLFHDWLSATIYFVIALASGCILKKVIAKISFE